MKKEVIRIGDKVKIINAEKFVRCGYPMDFKDTKDRMLNENFERIVEIKRMIMEAIKGSPIEEFEDEDYFDSRKPPFESLKEQIAGVFAFACVNYHGFGGNERKIYTVQIERPFDLNCIVIGKKTVITGKRCGGYDSDGWFPYLEDWKSHVVLEVSTKQCCQSFWIEAKNVEKVEK